MCKEERRFRHVCERMDNVCVCVCVNPSDLGRLLPCCNRVFSDVSSKTEHEKCSQFKEVKMFGGSEVSGSPTDTILKLGLLCVCMYVCVCVCAYDRRQERRKESGKERYWHECIYHLTKE